MFSLMKAYKKNTYISKNIYTIKTENISQEPNSPKDFIQGLIVFISFFVAETHGF